MNRFMKSQLNNALLSLEALYKGIEMAAVKDDGEISKEEKRQIRKVRKAVDRFKRETEKLMK